LLDLAERLTDVADETCAKSAGGLVPTALL